jgi:ribosomal-protein-alanine N-acetyltransferase
MLNFTPFPTLQTERLILRRILPSDAKSLFDMRNNVEVMRYIGKPRPKKLSEAEALIAKMEAGIVNNTGITWAISTKESPVLIGTIGFWRIIPEHFRAEIGYMLEPAFHGKGIMHEAMQPCLDYAFRQMGMHSIEANLNPDNTASAKLLQRNGFVQEAYFKENFYYDGRFLDSAVFSLVNPESGK